MLLGMQPYPNPYPGTYLFSQRGGLGPAAADSLPFVATQEFIRRGVCGAVDRCISLDTPVKNLYTNQLAGSRPPIAYGGLGPILPDTLSPGMDAYITGLECAPSRAQAAAAVQSADEFAAAMRAQSALAYVPLRGATPAEYLGTLRW